LNLIVSDNGIFQTLTWDLNSNKTLSLYLKTGLDSNAIHNNRPIPKWYSTVFLICTRKRQDKHVLKARSVMQLTFYQSNPKRPSIASSYAKSPQGEFSTSCGMTDSQDLNQLIFSGDGGNDCNS